MAHCRRTALAIVDQAKAAHAGALATMRMTPTATNDSQKPAASGARGSSNNTAIKASDHSRADADVPCRQPARGEQGEHQPGALRRHRESGQQRVGARGAEA